MRLVQLPISTPIAKAFHDETFYSVCCRQHRLLARADMPTTLRLLFGSEKHVITHDIPANLDSVSGQILGAWGGKKELIRHTILPFFLIFQSHDRIRSVIAAIDTSGVGTLKEYLGLHAGRFGADHPLKACTSCMETDRATYGVAYWHLMHQYPGVIICPVHGCMLCQGKTHRESSRRLSWILPDEENLYTHTIKAPSNTAIGQLKMLSESINELIAEAEKTYIDSDLTRLVYKARLDRFGKSAAGRAEAAKSFADYAIHLQPYPPLTSLPITAKNADAYIYQMVRKTSVHRHPLKHLVLINWLFGGVGPFIEAYHKLDTGRQQLREPHATVAPPPSRNTVIPASLGAPRPKKLKPLLRSKILARLETCASKATICSEFAISISTINRQLRAEPNLRHERASKHGNEKLEIRRRAFQALVDANPNATLNQVRAIDPTLYIWLYKNDRHWLLDISAKMRPGRVGNNNKVDWAQRDQQLLTDVCSQIEKMTNLPANKTRVIAAIPATAKVFKAPHNYPSTFKHLLGLIGDRG